MTRKNVGKYTKLKGKFDSNSIAKDITFQNTISGHRIATQKTYRNAIMHYCNCIEKSPTKFINEAVKLEKKDARSSKMTIKGYLGKYKEYINSLAPLTQHTYMIRVISFYKGNEVQVPDFYIEDAETIINAENIPTVDEVRKVLADCDLRHKCVILLQCSSGMGIAELLSITRKDFENGYDEETGITTFHPIRRKTTRRYTTFCTPECSHYIKLWLEECDRQGLKYDTLMGLTESGIKSMYRRASDGAGFTRTVGYRKITSHAMRKVFNQEMNKHGMMFDIVDFLSGRKPTKTRAAYRNYENRELLKEYKKHMETVTFIDRVVVYTDDRVKALEAKIKELEEMAEYVKIIRGAKITEDAKNYLLNEADEIRDREKKGLSIVHPHERDSDYR